MHQQTSLLRSYNQPGIICFTTTVEQKDAYGNESHHRHPRRLNRNTLECAAVPGKRPGRPAHDVQRACWPHVRQRSPVTKMKKLLLATTMLASVSSVVHAAESPTICYGEAVSSRAISRGHDGQVDSAIGTRGDTCLFAVESSIGRQIKQVCPIRDMNISDEAGPNCGVKAIVRKGIIRRIITIIAVVASERG